MVLRQDSNLRPVNRMYDALLITPPCHKMLSLVGIIWSDNSILRLICGDLWRSFKVIHALCYTTSREIKVHTLQTCTDGGLLYLLFVLQQIAAAEMFS